MIRGQRTAHRWLWVVVALAVLAMLALFDPPVLPVNAELPATLRSEP